MNCGVVFDVVTHQFWIKISVTLTTLTTQLRLNQKSKQEMSLGHPFRLQVQQSRWTNILTFFPALSSVCCCYNWKLSSWPCHSGTNNDTHTALLFIGLYIIILSQKSHSKKGKLCYGLTETIHPFAETHAHTIQRSWRNLWILPQYAKAQLPCHIVFRD